MTDHERRRRRRRREKREERKRFIIFIHLKLDTTKTNKQKQTHVVGQPGRVRKNDSNRQLFRMEIENQNTYQSAFGYLKDPSQLWARVVSLMFISTHRVGNPHHLICSHF